MARRFKAFTASVVAVLMAAVFMAGNFAYIQPVRAASLEGVTQADPGPVPNGSLRVHYQRADQQYGHMGLWLWGEYYDNPDMRAAMIDAMVYWVREADIDGYRADFASGVPQDFWETARRELDRVKPVYMLAEDDTQLGLLSQAFNSNYNMGLFYNIMKQIPGGGISAADVKAFLDAQSQKYPKGAYPMNYITNHDTNSWEGTASEMFGGAENLMAALSFTVPGIPLIYSGQEAGLNKRLQFFEKDEIDWSDLSKQDFYKRLIQTKRENPALWNGNAGGPVKYLAADDGQVLAFEREKDGNKVIVLLNLSGTARTAAVQAGASAGRYYDVFGQSYTNIGAGQSFTLAPWGYRIFAKSE